MAAPILDPIVTAHGRRWLYEAIAPHWPVQHRPAGGAFRQLGALDLAVAILRLSPAQVLQCLLQDPHEAAGFLLAQVDLDDAAGAEPQPDAVAARQSHGPEDAAAARPLIALFCAWCHEMGLPVWSGGELSTAEREAR